MSDEPFPNPDRQGGNGVLSAAGPGILSLFGPSLLGRGSVQTSTSQIRADVIGVYFSAHWCPPCRRFTPILAAVYNEARRQNKSFEVVFCSQDRDKDSFMSYFNTMPWLAVPFEQRAQTQMLGGIWGIRGIPSLVLVNHNGAMIRKDGVVQMISASAEGFIRSLPNSSIPPEIATPAEEPLLAQPPEEFLWTLDDVLDEIQADKGLNQEARVVGYKTILSVTQNIVDHPDVLKYRSLNKDNRNIQSRLGQYPSFIKLLKVAGFRETATRYVFPRDLKPQESRLEEVHQVLSCLAMSSEEPEKVTIASKDKPDGWVCEDGVCRKRSE